MIILIFCVFLIYGTLIESWHGTEYANRLVYKSWSFMLVQFCIFLSILFAALIRLPPKKQLYGFYTIHAGLIIIFIGAYVTYVSGIDGNIKLLPNQSTQTLEVGEDELKISQKGEDGEQTYSLPFESGVVTLDQKFKGAVLGKYYPFAVERIHWSSDISSRLPTSQFQLANEQTKEEFILSRHPSSSFGQNKKLGKLNLYYLAQEYEACFLEKKKSGILVWNAGKKTCSYVTSAERGDKAFSLKEYEKEPNLFLFGLTAAYFDSQTKIWKLSTLRDPLKLPWMGLELKLLRHETGLFAKTLPEYVKPVSGTTPQDQRLKALEVSYHGQKFWVTSREPVTFNTGNNLVNFELGKKKINLPYSLTLDKFTMKTDPGTNSAASYESEISLFLKEGMQKHRIFMNNPLKHQDFTFYQASFIPLGPNGFGSILSVNFDPGRFLKYLGSFLLVLGSAWHYFLRRKKIIPSGVMSA
ncbi:MAG: cytochrome c biogenesis protein ResB [Bdellovibrionales bacterium]|nr:cytochrome c biogenesis protein ResB [Bdellovibrionales bacterium]